MRITVMCPKCGLIRTPESDNICCEYCKEKMVKIGFDPNDFGKYNEDERKAINQRLYRKFLYNNPAFDEVTFEKRLEDEKREDEELEKKFASIPPSNTPKCPYCNSFYVEKITIGGRLLSTAMFGLGSSKVGKQWHCKQCGSNF